MSNDSLNPPQTQDSLRNTDEIVTCWSDTDTTASEPYGLHLVHYAIRYLYLRTVMDAQAAAAGGKAVQE